MILNELGNTIIENKLFTKENILEIGNYYLENLNIQNKIKKIEIKPSRIAFASYSPNEKRIKLNLDEMIAYFANEAEKNKLNKKDYYSYINLKILQFLFHEIEHVRQYSINKMDTVENILLTIGKLNMDIWGMQEDNLIYLQTYEYNPNERMADLNSYKKIIEYLNILKKYINIKKANNLIKKEYIKTKIKGYENDKCPSEIYLLETNFDYIWNNMKFYDENRKIMYNKVSKEYNLEERLYLGLPVENIEIKKLSFIAKQNMI